MKSGATLVVTGKIDTAITMGSNVLGKVTFKDMVAGLTFGGVATVEFEKAVDMTKVVGVENAKVIFKVAPATITTVNTSVANGAMVNATSNSSAALITNVSDVTKSVEYKYVEVASAGDFNSSAGSLTHVWYYTT